MKKANLLIAICLLISTAIYAEKIKVIPIIVTTNKIAQQTATLPVRLPDVIPIQYEETATPSWLIATPTASLTADIGGNQ